MALARAIGMVIIRRLAPQGLGANAIMRAMASKGGTYRKKTMLADIRRETGLHKHEKAIRAVSGNEVVPRSYMEDSDLKQSYKYKVYGKTNYYISDTDSYITKTESFYTDDLAKKGDWEQIYSDRYEKRYPEYDKEFVNFNMTAGEHNAGYGY